MKAQALPADNRSALSVRQISGRLGVAESTVRQWIATKKLRALQLPGTKRQPIYRVLAEDFERFVSQSVHTG